MLRAVTHGVQSILGCVNEQRMLKLASSPNGNQLHFVYLSVHHARKVNGTIDALSSAVRQFT